MPNNDQEHKKFLEDQIQWCKEQDTILEQIERKLHEMKRIAEYTYEQELTSAETGRLHGELIELKREVHALEKQLHSIVH